MFGECGSKSNGHPWYIGSRKVLSICARTSSNSWTQRPKFLVLEIHLLSIRTSKYTFNNVCLSVCLSVLIICSLPFVSMLALLAWWYVHLPIQGAENTDIMKSKLRNMWVGSSDLKERFYKIYHGIFIVQSWIFLGTNCSYFSSVYW
jgi:hypothetical protein